MSTITLTESQLRSLITLVLQEASTKKTAQKTLNTLKKKRKTFKGKTSYAFDWADDPNAALGAVYAKAGKSPKRESVLHDDVFDFIDNL